MKSIYFSKQKGEITAKELVFQKIKNAFDTLKNGEFILKIEHKEQKRSLSQNRLMWLWFACVEHETGQNKQDVHDYYCNMFLYRNVEINRRNVQITGGTSKLNTSQFKNFLNRVQEDVIVEFGIRLPNPEDLYFEEFENYYKNFI